MLDKTLQDAIVNKGRSFLRGVDLSDPIGAAFVSDQEAPVASAAAGEGRGINAGDTYTLAGAGVDAAGGK